MRAQVRDCSAENVLDEIECTDTSEHRIGIACVFSVSVLCIGLRIKSAWLRQHRVWMYACLCLCLCVFFVMHRLMCKCQRHYQYTNEFISRNHLQCNTLCVTLRSAMNERTHTHTHPSVQWIFKSVKRTVSGDEHFGWHRCCCSRRCCFCCSLCSTIESCQNWGCSKDYNFQCMLFSVMFFVGLTRWLTGSLPLSPCTQNFAFYLYLFNGSRLNVCIDNATGECIWWTSSIYSFANGFATFRILWIK